MFRGVLGVDSSASCLPPGRPRPSVCIRLRVALKDDVTELHCVNRSNAEAVGSDRLPKEEKELADTWVSDN